MITILDLGVRYPTHVITVRKNKRGWRWRMQAINKNIVGAATQTYQSTRAMCCHNLLDVTGVKVRKTTMPRHGGFRFEVNLYGDKKYVRITV